MKKAFSGLSYMPSMPAHDCRITGRTQCKEQPISGIERHYSSCFQVAADGKVLKSKTEAPFVWMNCDWDRPTLPKTKRDLGYWGALADHEMMGPIYKGSIEDFCKRQPEDFEEIAGFFRGLSTPETCQAYYCGDKTVYILLLCVIEDPDIKGKYSLVGLKTLMEKD